MKIAFDATALRADRLTGVERYAGELLRALLDCAPDLDWHILARAGGPIAANVADVATVHVAPRSLRVFRDQVWRAAVVRRIAPDVIHFPAFAPPVFAPPPSTRVVLTVHDAVPWAMPHATSYGTRFYYRPLIDWALKRGVCDIVLTVSRAAAEALRRVIPPQTPIIVATNGVAAHFRPGLEPPPGVEPRGYLLTVATREPRKNLGRLVEAYSQAAATNTMPPLVIIGRRGWGSDDAGAHSGISWIGRVDDELLARYYANCAAFVLPSLEEGFGLPLIEALASGAPAVASDIPALREVGADACLYTPPTVAGLREALRAVTSDADLVERLRRLAIERSRTFNWRETASRTLSTYVAAQ